MSDASIGPAPGPSTRLVAGDAAAQADMSAIRVKLESIANPP